MIRKAIIVVLAFAALGCGVAWATRLWWNAPGGPLFGTRFGFSILNGVVSIEADLPIPFAPEEGWGEYLEFGSFGAWVFPTEMYEYHYNTGRHVVGLEIPLWFLLALFSAYPLANFVRGPLRRHRRRRKGLCLKCGYNLTGNVSGVCPECGEAI